MNSNAYMAKYMLTRYHRRMKEAKEKLGNSCVKCGRTDTLELDHINPETKSFTIGTKLASVSEAKYIIEIAKCQLLCKQHHIEKTSSEKKRDYCKRGHKRTADNVNKIRACKQCQLEHAKAWKRKQKHKEIRCVL